MDIDQSKLCVVVQYNGEPPKKDDTIIRKLMRFNFVLRYCDSWAGMLFLFLFLNQRTVFSNVIGPIERPFSVFTVLFSNAIRVKSTISLYLRFCSNGDLSPMLLIRGTTPRTFPQITEKNPVAIC